MTMVKTTARARLASTSFSCDQLFVRKLTGREAISEPFVFHVEFIAPESASFSATAKLGQDLTIVLSVDDIDVRQVHGIVAGAVDQPAASEGYTVHRVRIVPRLHRLSLSTSCEVFLGKSVVDIATEKLARADLGAVDLDIRVADAPPHEFRLQYAESDLAFVSRHLEHAGIAYSFNHSGQRDVLVLSDSNDAFGPAVGPDAIPFVGRTEERGIIDLTVSAAMMTARHVVNDYVPCHPTLDVCAEELVDASFAGEVIDFGAGQLTQREGKHLARIRAQARRVLAECIEGESNVPYVEAARTIAVDDHPTLSTERLLVVSVEHELTQTTRMNAHDSAPGYENRFRAIPASRPYSPELRTPRPRISGFVTAVTDAPPAGVPGTTALIDAQGRYTVRFLFDRADGANRPVSSARLRMMQPHAGAGYGMHFPLKPGIEVAVAFYEGDPDRPVIAGAIPNALTPSPAMDRNAKINHLQTVSGISLKMRDS